MKNKIFLYSLTSLAVTASALAQANQDAYVPALEGGLTASVGTFYVTPTSNFQEFTSTGNKNFTNVENVNPGYEFGIDASLGYIFEKTANGVELFFRNISTSDTGSAEGLDQQGTPFVANGDLGYELDSFDLMFTQFVDLGQVMQVRFMGGLAYLDLNSNETATSNVSVTPGQKAESTSNLFQAQSKFRGWGPRVSIDTRYGFEDSVEGLGIVGGGSMAYFQGDMDTNVAFTDQRDKANGEQYIENNPGNHAVLNFRANLGLDYVFFFDNDEKSTMGLELGYLVDYYNDGAASPAPVDTNSTFNGTFQTTSVSFAGPYLNLKGAF